MGFLIPNINENFKTTNVLEKWQSVVTWHKNKSYQEWKSKTYVDNFKMLAINQPDDDFRKYKILNLETGNESDVDTDWFNTELCGRKIEIIPN